MTSANRAKSTDAGESEALLVASGMVKHFKVGSGRRGSRLLRAVDGVDLSIRRGETLGIIGESGSGKSTLGRTLLRLETPTSGRIVFDGMDITHLHGESLRRLRSRMNMVFQNPYSAMSPRHKIGRIVAEPLDAFRVGARNERRDLARAMLSRVGIPSTLDGRYPDAVSGGQLQRVAIARALITDPDLVVADEPTASLDVSIRAQIINLLRDLAKERQLSVVLISHDLRTVSSLADSLAVMYLGKVVERGSRASIERNALHPYTRGLIAAMPQLDAHTRAQRRAVPRGDMPSAIDPPSGCHYRPRCPLAMEVCGQESPALEEKVPGHFAACHAVASEVRAQGVRLTLPERASQ